MNARRPFRPVRPGRQYAIAVLFGVIAAAASLLLGSLASWGPMTGTGLPLALLFGIPIGALAAMACLAFGHGAWNAVRRIKGGAPAAAWAGAAAVATLGTLVSILAFSESQGFAGLLAITPAILVSIVGATAFYFEHESHSRPSAAATYR